MQQILQNLGNGTIELADVPCPGVAAGHVLIATRMTLISAGTERLMLDFGKANWIEKARSQPDKVRMVIDKVRTDGLGPTLDSVRAKLDRPVTPGYSNVGVVVEAGAGSGFAAGERVVSNGNHAEIVHVPKHLCARIPDGVSDEAAAFTVASAIALQGIRLAGPTIGETFAVTGLGLIGLLTVQILRANGCRVMGIDFDAAKVALARGFGAEGVDLSRGDDPVATAMSLTGGRGVDGVLIAAATKSDEPVHQAALMCRKRGRVVLVGVAGLRLSRDDFYKKELTFQVSCSYGPGRYDPAYEAGGADYPAGYVRWTEQRNFEAALELMRTGALNPAPLISHRFPLSEAERAYALLSGGEPYLGILLEYAGGGSLSRTVALGGCAELSQNTGSKTACATESRGSLAACVMDFIGAGGYASKVLMPAFQTAGATLRTVVSSGGVSASHYGRKFGFAAATTDPEAVFADESADAVAIATRHDSHAELVCRALRAGKHVFVEKPLAVDEDGLRAIEAAYDASRILMVGFNRRFAPHIVKMKKLLEPVREPKAFVMTVNAGTIPAEHWTHQSGGRITGEGCHFVDLLRFLAAAPVESCETVRASSDTATCSMRFVDGSIGTVHYFANGHKSVPKERLEVFCGGRVLQLDNFRRLTGFGWPGFRSMNLWRQDKGNAAAVAAFVRAVCEGGPSPIPFEELVEVARVTLRAAGA